MFFKLCLSQVHVIAGVSDDKIVMWEEVKGRWNAENAVKQYEGVIKQTLKRIKPRKPKHVVMEDGDPTGYKSNAAKAAKKKLNIKTLDLPPYSPDLNPLDFSLWKDIENRVSQKKIVGTEKRADFVKRLRLTALRTPKETVRKAMNGMKDRIKEVIEAKGGNIKRD